MPQAINTFSSGLNSDISDLKSSGTSYLDCVNFRLVSQEGRSTFALENTKGTSAAFKIPDVVYNVFFIDFSSYTADISIQIDNGSTGETPLIVANVANYSSSEIAALLLAQSYVTTQVNLGNYAVQYNNNCVVIAGLNADVAIQIYDTSTGLSTGYGTFYGANTSDSHVTVIEEIATPNIIGAINIKDTVVIFTTENEDNPGEGNTSTITSTGQIWTLTYDEDTNLISGLDVNGELVPSVHLKYHHNMNLTRFRKVSGEGRYEYAESQKVHFTDALNSYRLFNVASVNSFATPIEVIDYKPLHSATIPVIQEIHDGGFIPNGRIQYFYQLMSDLGTVTTYSTASNLISLYPSALSSAYQDIQGGNQGNVSGKAVTIQIEDLDTNYDRIKVGYILWESEDNATVRFFFEGSVPPSGTLRLTHSGNEDEVASDITLYRTLQAAFDTCKGLLQKKNILFAYNTVSESFDVDIDCRTYRFSASGYASLYDKEDTYGNPRFVIRASDKLVSVYSGAYGNNQTPPMNWEDIPEEADLINPYNNEDPGEALNNGDWFNNSQYKYQSDGVTLGGEGPIIRYEFTSSENTYDEIGDNIIDGSAFGIFTNTAYGVPLTGTSAGIGSITYSSTSNNIPPPFSQPGYNYPVTSGLASMKNPLLSSLFMGYSEGEVYRFAVPFFNKKSQPSFAKWIGDIKFPLQADRPAEAFYFDVPTHTTRFTQMGITFRIETGHAQFQAISDEIIGWQYVRVRRDLKDKTRLGTGIMNSITDNSSSTRYNPSNTTANSPGPDPQDWNPAFIRDYATFESPNFKFNVSNNYIAGDYIRFLKILGPTLSGTWAPAASTITPITADDSQIIKWGRTLLNHPISHVAGLTTMLNVPVSTGASVVAVGTGLDKPFVNMADENSTNQFESWGGYTHLISALGTSGLGLNPYAYPGIMASLLSGSTYSSFWQIRPYVSYERYLANQYNGNQWEVRAGQEYIGTTHFLSWNPILVGNSIITEVFGGDTLNTMFDFIKFDGNTSATESISGWSGFSDGQFVGQIFPSEVSFDLNLRQGRHLNNMSVHYNNPHHEDYTYNKAYSQENTSFLFYSKPYRFQEVNENPHRIWAFQEKFDGKFPDAWADVKVNEYIDVEGSHGPINRMELNNDKAVFYQDRAIGWASIKEQVTAGGTNTAATVLGTGEVLARYDYISKNTGCLHQWAVQQTGKGLYHFDATLKKIFLLNETGDKFGLSDLKGLNTKLQKTLLYSVKDIDLPLIKGGISIHTGHNPKHNEVFFTILDGYNNNLNALGSTNTPTTFTYNELTDCFDSRHDLNTSMFHRVENHLLSITPRSDNNLYSQTMFEHDSGLYNTYYGTLYPSTLTFLINPKEYSTVNKRLDIITLLTEITNTSGIDIPLETISTIRVYNNYQDSSTITLTPQVNIKKKLRSWRMNTLRDNSINRPRLKDKSFIVVLTFNNPNNHRLVLHDIQSSFIPEVL